MDAQGYSAGAHHLQPEDLPAVVEAVESAPHGRKREVVAQYAAHFNVSRDTIYRHLRTWKRRQLREVRTRSDAGAYTIPKETVRKIYDIQLSSADSQRCGRMISASSAIQYGVASGIIQHGDISPASLNRRLREEGYRIPRARIRIEAATVNERHLLDASGTRYFTVLEKLGEDDWLIGVRDVNADADKTKWKGERALWLVGIIDDCSRCAYVRYYATVGEDTFTTLSFLQEAWQFHPDVPFGGLPFNLQTDNSAFARNTLIRGFLEQPEINVHHTRTAPYEKESQGKIERLWRTLKSRFEHPFIAKDKKRFAAGQGREQFTLSELNTWLRNWLIEYNANAHPVESQRTRADIWQTMMARELLRQPPEDMATIAYGVEYKTLSAYADFQLKALGNNESGGWFHVPTSYARRRVLILRNVAGRVLVRDPLDIEQTTVEAELGRRSTRPTWDEAGDQGETIRIYDAYVTGTGLGRIKTPTQHVAETPSVTHELGNPYATRPGQPLHLAPRQAEPPDVKTPYTHSDEFFGADEAKRWLKARLGFELLFIKISHLDIWREIDSALKHSLNKEFLENRARDWSTELLSRERRAGFGSGA